MASSFRDDLYKRPNLAIEGVSPDYFRRPALPSWVDPTISPNLPNLPLPMPPGGQHPFPAPLPVLQRPPLEVDPSDRNPYNDPDYSPFLITQNPLVGAAGLPQGGLLGRLRSVLAERAGNTARDDGALNSPIDTAVAERSPESEDRPVRMLARRIVG